MSHLPGDGASSPHWEGGSLGAREKTWRPNFQMHRRGRCQGSSFLKCVVSIWALPVRRGRGCKGLPEWLGHFFYTFARLTEGASLSLCQKHKVQKHSTTKEQEQERKLRGGSSCSCSRLCFSITASPVSAYQLLRNANNQQQIKTPEVVMWEKAAGE